MSTQTTQQQENSTLNKEVSDLTVPAWMLLEGTSSDLNTSFAPSDLEVNSPSTQEASLKMNPELIETEYKYALSQEALDALPLEEYDCVTVTQHYLPREAHNLIVSAILQRSGKTHNDLPESATFSQARIRRVKDGDQKTYYLQAKAKFDGAEASEKIEIGVQIGKEEYQSLKAISKSNLCGMVKKHRYMVPGTITTSEGDIDAVAEIDVVVKAGPEATKIVVPGTIQDTNTEPETDKDLKGSDETESVEAAAYSIATVDIEVTSTDQLVSLKHGLHSFRFLDTAYLLTEGDSEIKKGYSTSSLGRKGLRGKVIEAVRAINEMKAETPEEKKEAVSGE